MPEPARRTRSTPPVPVTLTSTIAAALPHLPAALVGDGARTAMAAITDGLPAALTRRIYLECRLGEAAPRVDVVLCVDRMSRALLMEPGRAWLPAPVRVHPLWCGLARLCAEWADPQSVLGAAIYDLWLEFDALEPAAHGVAAGGHPLVPGAFAGLSRSRSTTPRAAIQAGLQMLGVLAGRPLAADVMAAAQHAVEHLPSGAHVPYVGLMYPRGEKTIRLCLSPLAGETLLEYLDAIAWPGDRSALAALLRSMPRGDGPTAPAATTLVHLDVGRAVQPRVGLEIPLPQYPRPVDGPDASPMLDALCASGLCAPAKRDALTRWPGYAVERFPHQCWPSTALRRVSHLKVVCDPGRIELKTYLSFFHDFLPASRRLGEPPA